MESDIRYYLRRAQSERLAAEHAITPEARERRLDLANAFFERVDALRREAAAA